VDGGRCRIDILMISNDGCGTLQEVMTTRRIVHDKGHFVGELEFGFYLAFNEFDGLSGTYAITVDARPAPEPIAKGIFRR
jgi:hypothetical protein